MNRELVRALEDIITQSSRKDRACDNKKYLVADLEIIEDKAKQALSRYRKESK